MTDCRTMFHVVIGDNVIPFRCNLPDGHDGAHRNGAAGPRAAHTLGVRAVDLGRGIMAEVALVEPTANSFAVTVDTDHTAITLDLTPDADGDRWVVEEDALLDALEGALRSGALAIQLAPRPTTITPAVAAAPHGETPAALVVPADEAVAVAVEALGARVQACGMLALVIDQLTTLRRFVRPDVAVPLDDAAPRVPTGLALGACIGQLARVVALLGGPTPTDD